MQKYDFLSKLPNDFAKNCVNEEEDKDGNEYWSAREVANTVGYKDFRNFKGLIEKARNLCIENSAKTEDHFVESTEMVELGSSANRSIL